MGHDLVAIDHFTSFGVFHKYVADLTVFSDAFLQSILHSLTPYFVLVLVRVSILQVPHKFLVPILSAFLDHIDVLKVGDARPVLHVVLRQSTCGTK